MHIHQMTYSQSLLDLVDEPEPSIIDGIEAHVSQYGSTQKSIRNGHTYYANEFWTAGQRQAARLHEISYRACFKPQLPEFFIDRYTRPGDTVYDPFMGRGTTPIQAALMGRNPIGNDVNPLSKLLIEPRLNPPSMAEIRQRIEEIDWEYRDAVRDDLHVFFHPDTLREIHAARRWFSERSATQEYDAIDGWIRMVMLNRLTGHSAGFLSVYSLPPNQAVTIDRQRKINEKRQQVPTYRNTRELILKKSRVLLGGPERPHHNQASLLTSEAHTTPEIWDDSVSLIVTSPPFLDIVNYASDNWLRCWFAQIDPLTVSISMHRKVEDWTAFVRRCFVEFERIVKPGGHVAFEVGEVRNGTILLEDHVIKAVKGLDFEVEYVLINSQVFTKTANCWGVSNNSKGTNSNRIVVVRKICPTKKMQISKPHSNVSTNA